MSNNKQSLHHKLIRQPLDEKEEMVMKKISSEELKNYALMQQDPTNSQAYILSKKYNLNCEEVEEALKLLKGDSSKFMYFTEVILNEFKINRTNYLGAMRRISEGSLESLKRQPTSLLEQAVMESENKFNLNLTQTSYKDVPESSSHYDEHFASRMDRQE